MGVLVFDIGGSSVKYAWASEEGALAGRGGIPVIKESWEQFLDSLIKIYESFRGDYPIEGIAVSAPGAVDCSAGVIHGMSAVPCIHEIFFVSQISKAMGGLPVTVENDGNCGVLGEYWKGAGRGKSSVAMVICGSGIGGGFIRDGKVEQTSHFRASDYGFMPIAREGGVIHPWSDFSVVNTVKQYNRDEGASVSGEELFDLAETDETAARYVERFYHYLAVGCMSVGFALDPEMIIIGGAISRRHDFEKQFQLAYSRLRNENKMFGECLAEIAVSSLGNDANLYGALYHYRNLMGNTTKGTAVS